MNRNQANDLVRQTLTHSFDKSRFATFVREILNHVDESKAGAWSTQYVKDAFKPHVHRYERLGTYTSPQKEKLDVLIVHLTTESKLERARTAIRDFVADHLKTRDEKDAALVAFVSPSESTWRFSYMRMEYATVEKATGRVAVETRLTPARRFSYIVGESESCHTAQSRFLALLQDTSSDPTLAAIEDAFSVEAVTKEFFLSYAGLFGQIDKELENLVAKDAKLRDEFAAKSVRTVDFAKKLLGQIVFLYFLQKKGWLGVARGQEWGSGPRDFLRRVARGDYGKYGNFFNDALKHLFYDTLATDRGHEAWCSRFNCRIPFLNGGLFEPLGGYDWQKLDIALPDRLFTNSDPIEEGVRGTGILDVFDRYNFTVNEAEPLEKEVAIDPEMLGKVFENLIEENRRKGLGAYYTPREIVHYMCQESLINYLDTAINSGQQPLVPEKPAQGALFGEPEPLQGALKTAQEIVPRPDIETFIRLGHQISHYESVDTKYDVKMPKSIGPNARLIDEKLAAITVCDPAVGSGAFPVGMMSEIVRARTALTPYFNDVRERTSYYFKRHAIQNCLYGVDIDPGAVEIAKLRLWLSLVVDEEDVKQIKPLPNLDYKIVTGNSLLGVERTLFNDDLFKQLEQLKPFYFDESDKIKKDKYRREIDGMIQRLTNGKQTFDFGIYFSEVFHKRGGFDAVIANPPYLGEKGHKDVFRLVAAGPLGKRFYTGKMDLFYFFLHLALDLASNRGIIAYISTNYFITATAAKVLRSDLKQRAIVRRMINFNELRIFESAQGQHDMITILQKGSDPHCRANTCITSRRGFVSPDVLSTIVSWTDPQTEYFDIAQNFLYDTPENYVKLRGVVECPADIVGGIIKKMRRAGRPLAALVTISTGIQTGADRVSHRLLEKYRLDAEPGDGIFVLSDDEVHRLQLPAAEGGILRPWFKNSDICRWVTKGVTDQKLIFADRRLNNLAGTVILKKHLLKFKVVIDECSSNAPYLHRPRSIDFEAPKIVVPQRALVNVFGFNQIPWYASVDVYFITDPHSDTFKLKATLALLNSRLYYLWFYHQGKRKGEALELYQKPLSETPIPEMPPGTKDQLVGAVDEILARKNRNVKAVTADMEEEIDRLVYGLYDLTPEEIALVKNMPMRSDL